MTLREYAEKNPYMEQDPEQLPENPARTYQELQEERERIQEMKNSISWQFENAMPTQSILHTALKLIGLLTHDNEWTEATTGKLESIYAGLEQESLFIDSQAAALDRLEKDFYSKVERSRKRLKNVIHETNTALMFLINAYEATERAEYGRALPAPTEYDTKAMKEAARHYDTAYRGLCVREAERKNGEEGENNEA